MCWILGGEVWVQDPANPCVVFLADHSTLTMPLSTQMYPGLGTGELSGKPDEMQGGNPVMDQHPIQGGVVILLVALRERNWDKPGWLSHLVQVQN